ncbi:pentapeptide repeat-containing protein [Methanococcoides sp. AM1]|uniref:pentapeptide repeat-containing protein n=1 Tax=Methanococcoides sp. AM1 TaxID=1201011 RepID=UPI00108418E8|nr:pentapeptide repeat-containing protein [Methanococcoides sp. AM1]
MRHFQETKSIIISIFIALIGFFLIGVIPIYQVSQIDATSISILDLAKLENEFRAAMAQIFGGLLLLIGIYLTWRRISAMEQTVEITQKGQITERFTRAIDQLGNDKVEVNTGGIYALERIANESSEDYWPIIEILTSYIRKNSPPEPGMERNELPIDIEAIINVLRRRKNYYENGEPSPINLKQTYLEFADLNFINLKGANLSSANLFGANLFGANLFGANLEFANLEEADLDEVNLNFANLKLANLKLANLEETDLESADLEETDLEGATLFGANILRAKFKSANLKNADFLSTDISIDQLYEAKNLQNIKLDYELIYEIREKHPHLFERL